jgi:hypothetical protein
VDPGEAIYQHITNGKPSSSEVRSFGDAIRYLVGEFGSASNAGRAAGVAPSSFRHWASGKRKPSRDKQDEIFDLAQAMQRRARLSRKRERKLRQPVTGFKMVGRLTYDSTPEPDRDVTLGPYLDDNVGDRLVDAYLDGASTDELAEILAESIADAPFYEETFDPYNDDQHLRWDIDSIEEWGDDYD